MSLIPIDSRQNFGTLSNKWCQCSFIFYYCTSYIAAFLLSDTVIYLPDILHGRSLLWPAFLTSLEFMLLILRQRFYNLLLCFFFWTRVIQKTSIPSTEKCDMLILGAGLEFKFWSLLSKEMHFKKKKPLKKKMKIKVQ